MCAWMAHYRKEFAFLCCTGMFRIEVFTWKALYNHDWQDNNPDRKKLKEKSYLEVRVLLYLSVCAPQNDHMSLDNFQIETYTPKKGNINTSFPRSCSMDCKDCHHKGIGVLWESQEPKQRTDLQVILACHGWPRLARPSVSFQGQLQGQGLPFWPTRQVTTAVTPTGILKIEGCLFASPMKKKWVGVEPWEDKSSKEWEFEVK